MVHRPKRSIDPRMGTLITGSLAGESWIYRLAWVFYLFLAVVGAFWMGWRERRVGLEHFVDAGTWWLDLAAGILAGVALVSIWLAARRWCSSAKRLETQLAELLGPLDRSEIMGLAMLSGFSEELFFRGAMQGAWGWLPATVLFALLHSGPGAAYRIWTAFAAVAGVVLAGLMIWRGNLLAPVVAHTVVNGWNLGRLARDARKVRVS